MATMTHVGIVDASLVAATAERDNTECDLRAAAVRFAFLLLEVNAQFTRGGGEKLRRVLVPTSGRVTGT